MQNAFRACIDRLCFAAFDLHLTHIKHRSSDSDLLQWCSVDDTSEIEFCLDAASPFEMCLHCRQSRSNQPFATFAFAFMG